MQSRSFMSRIKCTNIFHMNYSLSLSFRCYDRFINNFYISHMDMDVDTRQTLNDTSFFQVNFKINFIKKIF